MLLEVRGDGVVDPGLGGAQSLVEGAGDLLQTWKSPWKGHQSGHLGWTGHEAQEKEKGLGREAAGGVRTRP